MLIWSSRSSMLFVETMSDSYRCSLCRNLWYSLTIITVVPFKKLMSVAICINTIGSNTSNVGLDTVWLPTGAHTCEGSIINVTLVQPTFMNWSCLFRYQCMCVCNEGMSGCARMCTTTIGSYLAKCSCRTGFVLTNLCEGCTKSLISVYTFIKCSIYQQEWLRRRRVST